MAWIELTNAENGKVRRIDHQTIVSFEELDDTTTVIDCSFGYQYRVIEGAERVLDAIRESEEEDQEAI